MSPDEAADVLGELEEETSEEILEEMESEPAEEVRELLEYDEDTAGGMMNTEYDPLRPPRPPSPRPSSGFVTMRTCSRAPNSCS